MNGWDILLLILLAAALFLAVRTCLCGRGKCSGCPEGCKRCSGCPSGACPARREEYNPKKDLFR